VISHGEIKSPNDLAHRSRASDAWHATATQSRGSVQSFLLECVILLS